MNYKASISEEEMAKLAQAHVDAEIQGDIATTMATMCNTPHIFTIPAMQVAIGLKDVKEFYARLLPEKFFPPDVEIIPVSRTVGNDQIVEENIFKFTHTIELGWMLPGIAPTGKRVEIPMIVIFKFTDGKLAHEHLYWDQASVLVQIGLLNPEGLPIHGIDAANKMSELIRAC